MTYRLLIAMFSCLLTIGCGTGVQREAPKADQVPAIKTFDHREVNESAQRAIFADWVTTRTQTFAEFAEFERIVPGYDARGEKDFGLNQFAVKHHITEKDVSAIEATALKYRWSVRPDGSSSLVGREDYLRLTDGMTYLEAIYVLGIPGDEMSRTSVGGIVTTLYAWANADGSNVNVTFQNDRLVSKAQAGLR